MVKPSKLARYQLGVTRWQVFGAILVVLAVVGIQIGINVLERGRSAQEQEKLATIATLAAKLAINIRLALNPQNSALDALAQNPQVVAALSATDESARQALAQTLQKEIPGALSLRLVPSDAERPDDTSHPPLTYSGLSLLRSARGQETPVNGEYALVGTKDEHLALVRRVPPAGLAVGTLLLAVDPKILPEKLKTLDPGGYAIELRQPMANGPPTVLARLGQADSSAGSLLQLPLSGTSIQLVLLNAAGEQANASSFSVETLTFPALGLLLFLLISLLVRFRRRQTAVRTGGAVDYQGAIRAIFNGEYPGMEAVVNGTAVLPVARPPLLEVPARAASAVADTAEFAALTDSDLFDLSPDDLTALDSSAPADLSGKIEIAPSIFRSYDIRGIAHEALSAEAVGQIARAIGAEAQALGQQTVVVARDGRNSSPAWSAALIDGLRAAGSDVLDIGLTPTPLLYFATHYLNTRTGVMLTGSHNPPDYNGLKIVMNGRTLCGEAIQAIRRRVLAEDFPTGHGALAEMDILSDYIRRISDDIPVTLSNPLKVVVDCGNAVPGLVAPQVLRALGHEVIELHCDLDGDFPHHAPDPSQPANLEDLILAVGLQGADLGLAFDGDGDRLGVVDRHGKVLWPDRQLMLFARDLLSRNPGAGVVFDVKCSRKLAEVIRAAGGEPLMWKSGHSLIKAKMEETGALLGGEMTGHLFFTERWYGFDDAIYAAARLLEILVKDGRPAEAIFAELPETIATPELHLEIPEDRHAEFMARVLEAARFEGGEVTLIDGLRVDYPNRWGLIRPSNTTPCIVLRFEGDDEKSLAEVQNQFRVLLLAIDPSLNLPF